MSYIFIQENAFEKCRLANGGDFFSASMCKGYMTNAPCIWVHCESYQNNNLIVGSTMYIIQHLSTEMSMTRLIIMKKIS